jgi:hypothetical protein
MSTPKSTGASRRLRTAGLALFALAAIAVLIGLVVAVTRGEQTSGEPPGTPAPPPTSASAGPSVIPFPPSVTSGPAEAPAVSPPGSSDAAGNAPASDQGHRDNDHRHGKVRVYNNSTIRGLAARAARDLRAAGWTVVEVGNYARGTIPTTTAYYQEGTDQRADAEALGTQFGMRVEPRFPGIANAGPGLVVIVTNDYSH